VFEGRRCPSGARRWRASADAHVLDVDEQGNGAIAEQRLYQLIRQSGAIVDRTLEIPFPERGVEACVFTFGYSRGLDSRGRRRKSYTVLSEQLIFVG
jgi:hypothetical protein